MLAGTVETAVNALWDAAPLIGDRIAVVGAGMVGVCVARLLARIPGVDVTLVDVDPARAADAPRHWGCRSPCPAAASGECDLVVHTSASSAGLQLSLDLLGSEGIGRRTAAGTATRETTVRLGGSFHSGSADHPGQPGRPGVAGPPGRRGFADRLALALQLLQDAAFDAAADRRPRRSTSCLRVMPRIADGSWPALCHVIEYPATEEG